MNPIAKTDSQTRVVHPAVDVFENDDGLLLRADLPGVSESALDVQLDNGLLTLVASRTLPEFRGGGTVEYRRRFHVPRDTDGAKVTAHIDRGVLSITLPKSEAARPRSIPITRG